MSRLICNKKGVTLVEVLVAIVLTALGVLAILAVHAPGWKNMAKADYLGRASGILHKTLEQYESYIENPCNGFTVGDQTAVTIPEGDVTYTIHTHIAQYQYTDPTSITHNYWVVTVYVTWPPVNTTTGIQESLTVTRQEPNRYPASCPSAGPTS